MSNMIASVLLMFLTCIAAESQTAAKQTKGSIVAKELMQLERDWSAAFLKHSTSTIDCILADETLHVQNQL